MQYLAGLSGVAALVASLLVYWYRRKADDLARRLVVAESVARTRAAINEELRGRLAKALKGVRASLDKEAASEAARADSVTGPADAADLLNDVVRTHR